MQRKKANDVTDWKVVKTTIARRVLNDFCWRAKWSECWRWQNFEVPEVMGTLGHQARQRDGVNDDFRLKPHSGSGLTLMINTLKPGLLGEFAVAGQSKFAARRILIAQQQQIRPTSPVLMCLILCCCYRRQHMGHYKSMYNHVQIQIHNNCNVRNVAMRCHDLAFLITCHD